jgi:hypothetical protein
MTEDENIIHIFINTDEIGKNKCIPLSDKDYEKIKNYGNVKITIINCCTYQHRLQFHLHT